MAICYLCGIGLKRGLNQTREHLPPKGFFPEGTDQFTIPCCNDCQDEFKDIDEEMRNKFAFSSEYSPQEVRDRAYRALQMGRPKFERMSITDAVDSQGRTRLRINFGPNWEKWISKIIRGAHFGMYGERLLPERVLKTIHLPTDDLTTLPEELRSLLDSPRLQTFYCALMPHELVPAFGDANNTIWMNIFYQKLFFLTIVS